MYTVLALGIRLSEPLLAFFEWLRTHIGFFCMALEKYPCGRTTSPEQVRADGARTMLLAWVSDDCLDGSHLYAHL